MSILYFPLHDVWAMGLAVAIAIGIFAMLFAVPLTVLWLATRSVGLAWHLTMRTGGALRARGPASRRRHTFGATVRSRRT